MYNNILSAFYITSYEVNQYFPRDYHTYASRQELQASPLAKIKS
nr:MAG TPA_asm: hypothetical protein [Caudoviricetes sp.]